MWQDPYSIFLYCFVFTVIINCIVFCLPLVFMLFLFTCNLLLLQHLHGVVIVLFYFHVLCLMCYPIFVLLLFFFVVSTYCYLIVLRCLVYTDSSNYTVFSLPREFMLFFLQVSCSCCNC